MVITDIVTAYLTATYSIITGDSVLQNIMNGVRLRYDWAQKDETFPYLIHRFSLGSLEPWALRNGTYFINIWDYADTADRILQIRDRLIFLLDERLFSIDDNGEPTQLTAAERVIDAVRFYLDTDQPVDELEQNIWRHHLTFSVRFGRSKEVRDILSR